MKPTFLMSFKIWWSMTWRSFLGMLIAITGFWLAVLLTSFIVALSGMASPGFAMFLMLIGIIAYVIVILEVYRWVLNSLPGISYREGTIDLMKDSVSIERYSIFDTICVMWSLIWRSSILGLIFSIIVLPIVFFFTGMDMSIFTIPESSVEVVTILQMIPPLLMAILTVGQLILSILTVMWMLACKKTGRWLRLSGR